MTTKTEKLNPEDAPVNVCEMVGHGGVYIRLMTTGTRYPLHGYGWGVERRGYRFIPNDECHFRDNLYGAKEFRFFGYNNDRKAALAAAQEWATTRYKLSGKWKRLSTGEYVPAEVYRPLRADVERKLAKQAATP